MSRPLSMVPTGREPWRLVRRYTVSLLPGAVLAAAAYVGWPEPPREILILAFWLAVAGPLGAWAARRMSSPAVAAVYVAGLVGLSVWPAQRAQWFAALAQAGLLGVAVSLLVGVSLRASGAAAMRRARQLLDALAARSDWPRDPAAARDLPEVAALREALQDDAAPALAFLQHPSAHVRVAVLAALESRGMWRPGQFGRVLDAARREAEPAVRAAAVRALAAVEDRGKVEALAGFLLDADVLVRRATAESLFWRADRWRWATPSARAALADPRQASDGPLVPPGQPLPEAAVADVSAWTGEAGLLGVRATQTLAAHYAAVMSAGPSVELAASLRDRMLAPRTPSLLKIELGQLLRQHNFLETAVLERLIEPAFPGALRLIGAEGLLQQGPNERAAQALRDIARQPNRELALAAAGIIQRCLRVDLGLPLHQPLPAPQSRQAVEVTRRAQRWAADLPITPMTDPPSSAGGPQGSGSGSARH